MATRTTVAPSSSALRAVPAGKVLELLQKTSREVRDLDVGRTVDRVPLNRLTPMLFATEYVQRNKPVVITGAIDGWPASDLWDEHYLINHPAGEVVVTVDVTPNGRGDAVTTVVDSESGAARRWFVTPHERRMTLREFFRLMRETHERDQRAARGENPTAPREVPYMQHQNSNLSEELGLLLGDIAPGLPWAERVFGGPPQATNIWIGDERSATSFHKDHYENLYAVLSGTKIFTLMPPCDAYRMYLVRCPAASYMPCHDVPSGVSYGDVAAAAATRPGTEAPTPAIGETEAAPESKTGTPGEAEADVSGRLVAVLQDPGYEVLWSAVDTTLDAKLDLQRAQPLFYGSQRPTAADITTDISAAAGSAQEEDEKRKDSGGGGGDDSKGGCSDGSNGSAHHAEPPSSRSMPGEGRSDSRRAHRGEESNESSEDAGSPEDDRSEDEDGDGEAGSCCSSDSETDPWDCAGGAPLVVEVGPGEVLYLPSLWYHQVEQRPARSRPLAAVAATAASGEAAGKQRSAIEVAAANIAAAKAAAARAAAARAAAGAGEGLVAAAATAGARERGTEGRGEAGGQEEEGNREEEQHQYVIAVNFWYDMKYDSRFAAFKLVEGLATALGCAEEPPQRVTGAGLHT